MSEQSGKERTSRLIPVELLLHLVDRLVVHVQRHSLLLLHHPVEVAADRFSL